MQYCSYNTEILEEETANHVGIISPLDSFREKYFEKK